MSSSTRTSRRRCRQSIGVGLLLSALVLTVGCAGGGMALKVVGPPLDKQCAKVQLKACPTLTEGVLLYIQGDQEGAKSKLKEAGAANSPEKVKQFAVVLQSIAKLPGADKILAPAQEAIDFLASASEQAGGAGADATGEGGSGAGTASPVYDPFLASAAGVTGGSIDPSSDPTRLDGGTVFVSQGSACVGPSSVDLPSRGVVCTSVGTGPLVVTDVIVSPACKNAVFMVAESGQSVRWQLGGLEERPQITGARLLVRAGETVRVTGHATAKDGFRNDSACWVTWSGFRI